MKLRQQPEDFIVEEEADFSPSPKGQFFVYQLTKRSLSTFEALEILRRAGRLRRSEAQSAGLKDKHAVTTQLVSLKGPLPGGEIDERIQLRLVGKASKHLNPGNVIGNRFNLIARNLREEDVIRMRGHAPHVARDGVPNFYDSQRFGASGTSEEMPGRHMLLGNFEEALRLHLAVPRRKQGAFDKRIRRICKKYWGEWERLQKKLPKSSERSIIAYLNDHPGDFAGALDRVDKKITGIYLAAYQSLLFNLTLNDAIRARLGEERVLTIESRSVSLNFWRELRDDERKWFHALRLPLLNHRTELSDFDNTVKMATESALEHEGLKLDDLKLRGMDSVHLYGAERMATSHAEALNLGDSEPDELNEGSQKLGVSFRLGRGSYATIVIEAPRR